MRRGPTADLHSFKSRSTSGPNLRGPESERQLDENLSPGVYGADGLNYQVTTWHTKQSGQSRSPCLILQSRSHPSLKMVLVLAKNAQVHSFPSFQSKSNPRLVGNAANICIQLTTPIITAKPPPPPPHHPRGGGGSPSGPCGNV